jgi:hypothetical protein
VCVNGTALGRLMRASWVEGGADALYELGSGPIKSYHQSISGQIGNDDVSEVAGCEVRIV